MVGPTTANVIHDTVTEDERWLDCLLHALAAADDSGSLFIKLITYAQVSVDVPLPNSRCRTTRLRDQPLWRWGWQAMARQTQDGRLGQAGAALRTSMRAFVREVSRTNTRGSPVHFMRSLFWTSRESG